jgi:hypothetical protein
MHFGEANVTMSPEHKPLRQVCLLQQAGAFIFQFTNGPGAPYLVLDQLSEQDLSKNSVFIRV